MKQNEANMWDKQMSMAQVFGQMVAGSFFAVLAIGIPIALLIKGIVLLALGLTSIIYRSFPLIAY